MKEKFGPLKEYIVYFMNNDGDRVVNQVWLPKMSKKELMDVIHFNAPAGYSYLKHREVG